MAVEKDEVTIVLPTLNEEKAVRKVINELKKAGYNNILIVDGYSTDKTARIAESNGARVVLQHSRGKSGALETAVENVDTPFMLVMDCDCTYDPKDIEKLLAHAKIYDQVIGARINGRENIPRFNRLGNWLITSIFNTIMGTKLSDVCSGMYLIKTDAARMIEFNTKGFDVEVEMAAQIAANGRITEVPIAYRKRVGKQKLRSWKHGWQILHTLFSLARRYNPVLLFSGLIALAAVPAFFLIGWAVLEVLLFGVWNSGRALIGLILFVFAFQGFTIATVSLMLKNLEK
ncbi:MAG: glycosyltransferase family 2 protein, partial [Candidatus Bathyarchaeia archaeon]